MKWAILFIAFILAPLASAQQLSTVTAGSGINQTVTVTSSGQFRLVFESQDNWGIAQWYDLVNDPNATTNLVLAYGVGGPGQACERQNSLANMTFYGDHDAGLHSYEVSCYFNSSTRSLTILASSPSLAVIQTTGQPLRGFALGPDTNLTATITYYIYPNGKIYISSTLAAVLAQDLGTGGTTDLFYGQMDLNDPAQTGTGPPDSQVGWVRATNLTNPWDGTTGANKKYVFAYWDATTPTYGNFTKASIMMVLGPNHPAGNFYQIIHSWGCGAGCGTLRWGFRLSPGPNFGANGTITQNFLIQLGTQGSSVLPNLTTIATCDTIANAYLNNPVVTAYFPYVNQGQTLQLVEQEGDVGTWSVSGTDSSGSGTAGLGSVNGSGVYTAPATVTPQQSEGGYQLFPNNHVFNTRIDALGVNANSATWLTLLNGGGSVLYGGDTYNGFSINYTPPQTTFNDTFLLNFTPLNNWTYPVPNLPGIDVENGWFSARIGASSDHHILQMNPTTGTYTEIYQYFPYCATTAASVLTNVATLTLSCNPQTVGFSTNSAAGAATVSVVGFSGADTYFNGSGLALTAVTTNSISYALTHANASATTNGAVNSIASCTTACNADSALQYNWYDYTLPANGSTDAAGMELQPLMLRMEEFQNAITNSSSINHALRITFGQGFMCSCFIWPATTTALDGATVPFGARVRLKSSFAIGGYSAAAQILLTQMKNYGFLIADGGNNWDVSGERNTWTPAMLQAFSDVNAANIPCTVTNTAVVAGTATVTCTNSYAANYYVTIAGTTNDGGILNGGPYKITSATGAQFQFAFGTNFASAADSGTVKSNIINYMEFVDESGMMVSSTSGLTTHNREIVTFTRTSDSATAATDIALMGVAVNFPQDYYYITAGTPSQQLPTNANIGAVTWTMSPSIGSLTAGGLFTPPATLASATTSTFTATSTTNAAIAAQLQVTVFPNGVLRILPGQTSNYVDSIGNTWWGFTGTNQPQTLGCCAGISIPAMTDVTLWNSDQGLSSGVPQTRVNVLVPNGIYTVTYHVGTQRAPGTGTTKLSVNGNFVYTGDISADAGGANKAFTVTMPNVVVTNNQFNFVVWNVQDHIVPIASLSLALMTGTTSQMQGSATIQGGAKIQ